MTDKLAINGGKPVIAEPLPTIRNASGRLFGEEEKKAILEVMESGTLCSTYGKVVRQFERKFADLLKVKHAIAVSSGTAALHTAMVYLNPNPGDEILVSPITDMGTIIAILSQLAVPVFVDIDPFTQNIDPAELEKHISPRTKAILPVHIYGSPADMDPIMEVARKHNLFVIEDCAQAHLTEYKGRLVGTIGDMGCFSFQQSKHITTGDGGMVVTNVDKKFGRELRLCADKGWPRQHPVRDHYFLAPNYHMTEIQAAIGIAQMDKYSLCIERRRSSALKLDQRLSVDKSLTPVGTYPNCKHTYFHYCFGFDLSQLKVDGVQIVQALKKEGVECDLGYPGAQPLYMYSPIKEKKTFGNSGLPFTSPPARKQWDYDWGLCPKAEKVCKETVIMPWNEGITEEHVNLLATAILKVFSYYKK